MSPNTVALEEIESLDSELATAEVPSGPLEWLDPEKMLERLEAEKRASEMKPTHHCEDCGNDVLPLPMDDRNGPDAPEDAECVGDCPMCCARILRREEIR